jgi:hypothetical protein
LNVGQKQFYSEKQLSTVSVSAAVLYSARYSRPDVLAAANHLIRQPSDGANHHLLRYLAGTPTLSVRYTLGDPTFYPVLFAYSDAEWAGDYDRKSCYGYTFFCTNIQLTYVSPRLFAVSKKHPLVADSVGEAETMALSETSNQGLFFRNVLKDLGYNQEYPTVIFTDSKSSLELIKNRRIGKSKTWDTKYKKMFQHSDRGIMDYVYCPRSLNVADFLANPRKLSRNEFTNMRGVFQNQGGPVVTQASRDYQAEVGRFKMNNTSIVV